MTSLHERIKQIYTDPSFPGKRTAGALTFLALALALYSLFSLPFSAEEFVKVYGHAGDAGGFLLYGIRTAVTGGITPLEVFFALFRNLVDWMPLVLKAVLALIYVLAYELGRARGGRLAGALYLFSAVLVAFSAHAEPGQLFAALFILLYLNMEGTGSFSAGLALGFAVLIQPPLFLLPLAAALRLYKKGQPARQLLRRALPLIAGAYILLLPAAGLRYSLSAVAAPAAQASPASASGGPEQPASLSGHDAGPVLAGTDVPRKPAAAEALSGIYGYSRDVLGRARKAFQLFPYSFALALLALVFFRERVYASAVWLGLFLMLLCCLFPGQEAALYQLKYLFGFIVVSALRIPGGPSQAAAGWAFPSVRLIFSVVLIFNLFTASLALAYPFRAKKPTLDALTDAISRHPDAAWLLREKGERLLRADMTDEGLRLLKLADEKDGAGDVPAAYIMRTLRTDVPEPPPDRYRYYDNGILSAVRLLRELDLDRRKEAEAVYYEMYKLWDSQTNVLNGIVYERDNELLKEPKTVDNALEDLIIRDGLRYWDKARRPELIARLKNDAPGPFKSGTSAFLALPLKTPRDLAAFRAYVERTSITEYVEPFHYDKTGRKFLEGLRLAGGGAGESRGTLLGLVSSALQEQAAGAGAARGLAPGETLFSIEELKLLRELTLRNGDLSLLNALIKLDPERPVYFSLYAEASAAGRDSGGLALEIFKDYPGIFLSAAAYYSARDKRKEALLLDYIYGKAAVLAPEQLRWAVQPLQERGRYAEALTFMNACISEKPKAAELYVARGNIFRFMGNSASAEKDFTKALEVAPGFLEAELDLAAVYAAGGKATLTAEERARFAAGPPEAGELEALRGRAGLLLVSADFFQAAGFQAKAAALLDFALKDPSLSLEQLRRAALTYQNLGRMKEALSLVDGALAGHSGSSELFNDRGVLMQLMGKPGPAEQDFLKALALRPDSWQAQINLLSLLSASGRRAEAAAIRARLLRRTDLPAAAKASLLVKS